MPNKKKKKKTLSHPFYPQIACLGFLRTQFAFALGVAPQAKETTR